MLLLWILLAISVLPPGQFYDSMNPAVRVTSPAEDETVSGIVTITADATDDEGVAGVTFEVDGAVIGAEDTSAPWSIAWNAAEQGRGSHVITAVARDGAGNAARSEIVAVVVGSVPPPSFPTVPNHSPIAGGDTLTSAGRVPVAFTGASLLANDRDPDSHLLHITVVAASSTAGATVLHNGGDTYTYTPLPTFQGVDTFTYSIADSLGGAATTTVSVHVTPPAPSGLVLALTFDESMGTAALDSSGGSRHGAILGAERVTGKSGGALKFDGVDDWVTVADAPALRLATAMTIEAWVYPSALSGWDTIALKESGTGDMAYGLYAHDGAPLPGGVGAPGGYVTAGAVHRIVHGPSALPLNAWTHVATTYDGTTQRLFLNGALVKSRAQAGAIATSTGALRLGGNAAWEGEFFTGLLDEVRIYNRALSDAEIAADMNGTAPAPPPPPPPPPTPTPPPPAPPATGLVVALGFDETAGTIAADLSGAGRNGTVQHAAFVAGKYGNALSFDGVDDWVTVPDSAALDLTNGMTIEAWVRPAALSGWQTIVLKERGTGDLAYGLYAHDGAPLAGGVAAPAGTINIGGTHHAIRGLSALANNTWTHVATTYDGSSVRFYVNGVLVSSRAQTGSMPASTSPLRIGGNEAWAGEFFHGLIDEVRIYNRALSAAEIQADMAAPVR